MRKILKIILKTMNRRFLIYKNKINQRKKSAKVVLKTKEIIQKKMAKIKISKIQSKKYNLKSSKRPRPRNAFSAIVKKQSVLNYIVIVLEKT